MTSDGFSRHTPVLSGEKIVRLVSVDISLIPHFSDAIVNLTDENQWLEVGDSVDDVVRECFAAVDTWYGAMNIGQIVSFLGALPDGWLPLDGSTYNQADYPELAEVLDEQFRDDVAGTFTLPDLGGVFPLVANGSYALGTSGGSDAVTLTVNQIPSHRHTYIEPVANIDLEAPGAPDILAAGVGPGTFTGYEGGSESHDNMPPYVALTYGVFCGRL